MVDLIEPAIIELGGPMNAGAEAQIRSLHEQWVIENPDAADLPAALSRTQSESMLKAWAAQCPIESEL